MRDRLAYLGALLSAACASAPGSLRIPETTLPLDTRPPPLAAPPAEGANDSVDSRFLTCVVDDEHDRFELSGWCRVGVWTTLDNQEGLGFVLRESWGRLGERRPRLLARIEDDALEGIVLRLRPEADGSLSFQAEIAVAEVLDAQTVGIYHGQRVVLRPVRRRGFRFAGTAPPAWTGVLAAWRPGVALHLGSADHEGVRGPGPFVRQRAPGALVTLAGTEGSAESFVEDWVPRRPVHVVEDGVERMDFRLAKERRATGFAPDGHRGFKSYGGTFVDAGRE